MQIQDQPHIGVLGADPAAITQFLRRVQALGGEHAVLLPLSPAAVPDCEPYLCGASTQPPLPKLRAAAEVLAASGCTVIAVPDSAGIFCAQLTAAAGVPVLSTADAAMPQLVGALRQRVSILCTPGVRAANAYGLAAQRYGLQCSYPDAPAPAASGRKRRAASRCCARSSSWSLRAGATALCSTVRSCAPRSRTSVSLRAIRRYLTAWSCWRRPRCSRAPQHPAPAAHKIANGCAPKVGRAAAVYPTVNVSCVSMCPS